ncbi:MAG: GGDEF domain-containing protein [Actinoplanes sp.]
MRRADPLLILLVLWTAVVPALFGVLSVGLDRGGMLTGFWILLAVQHLGYGVMAWRVARTGGPARRLWLCVAGAGVAMSVGDVHQVFQAATDWRDPASYLGTGPGLGSLLLAMILLLVGLLRHGAGTGTGGRSGTRLDVATVMAGAATAGMLLIALPSGPRDASWALTLGVTLLVQPGIFLLVLFAVVRLVIGGRSPFSRVAGWINGVAAVVQVGLQAVPGDHYLDPQRGAWLAGANLFTGSLVVIAARYEERHRSAISDERERRPYSWLPYGAMLLTWALGIGVLAAQGLNWRAWAVIAGAMLTTALVVARQAAAFRHIGELLRERDALTARLTEMAFHDALTGLANRALFMRRLAEAQTSVTVFLIDLDDFKPVNDSYGHAAGDQLLIEAGRRLRDGVRAEDTVARLGGDEFAVLMPGLDPARASQVRRELMHALNGKLRLGDIEVDLRASIGMATGRCDQDSPDALLHEADMAMYAKKNAARAVRR